MLTLSCYLQVTILKHLFIKFILQVASPVVGGLVVGLPVFNLSDPVYILLWSSEDLDSLDHGAGN